MLFPFLSNTCSPLDRGESKKTGDWNWAGHCGALPGIKTFPRPLFLVCREQTFSLLDLLWAPKGRFSYQLGKCRKRHFLVPPVGMCIPIWYVSLSSYTATKAVTQVEDVASGWAQRQGPQPGWNQKADDWDPCYLTTKQSEEGYTPCSPPPQILSIKTSSLNPSGISSLLSMSYPFSLLGPAINLSLLQTLMFQFVWSHCASGTWTWVQQQWYIDKW